MKEDFAAQFHGLETGVCPLAKRRWLKPELVAQIEFTDWTAANHLWHSNSAGLRDDRNPREAVRESGPWA